MNTYAVQSSRKVVSLPTRPRTVETSKKKASPHDAELNEIYESFLARKSKDDSGLLPKGQVLQIGRHRVEVVLELGSGGEGHVVLVRSAAKKHYALKLFSRDVPIYLRMVCDELAQMRNQRGFRTLRPVASASGIRVDQNPRRKLSGILFDFVRGIPASAFLGGHEAFVIPASIKADVAKKAKEQFALIDAVGPDNALYDIDRGEFVVIDIG